MALEQDKTTMRRFLEAFVGDPDALPALLAPGFVAHLPAGPAGVEAFVGQAKFFGAAFSNMAFEVLDQVAEGDRATVRAVWRGTHTGDFMGIPPTGRRIQVSAFILDRFEDGRIVEHWSLFDNLGMMQQLGAGSDS